MELSPEIRREKPPKFSLEKIILAPWQRVQRLLGADIRTPREKEKEELKKSLMQKKKIGDKPVKNLP